MMRENLKQLNGVRVRFTGVFEKYGLKSAYKGLPLQTLLLQDIKRNGDLLTDHLWFNLTKGFDGLGNLYPGDVVAFDARVGPYVKGYAEDREVDFNLKRLTKVELIKRADREDGDVYTVCSECGYRNRTRSMGPSCRRCGHRLGGGEPPQKPEPQPQYSQLRFDD